ncbi:MAG: ABC transporter permease subunit, partial [Oscillospiraceae bacterium]|nr:ABC transporter permease subunit [Oscillospiraceae bacterium]
MSFSTMVTTMIPGMGRTLLLFFLSGVLSLLLGVVVMFLRQSKIKVISAITRIYISVMRGTPLMLQLLAWYFGPYYIFGWSIRGYRFTAIVLGFVFNYAAYFAEIYRSGMESIPVGQTEAAQVLGYTKNQTFMKIILPQVVKRILPSVTNEIITLVKDTSLAFA